MRLFYREYGSGEPVIIVHGLFGMSDNWMRIAKILSKNFKIYLLDLRNHGQSPHSNEHTYQSMSEDIIEFMNDKKIKNTRFIGHSMGGKVVLQTAKNHPDKIRSMIIVDISPKEYIHDDSFLQRALNHKLFLETIRNTDISRMKSRKEISDTFKKTFNTDFILQMLQKNIYKNAQNEFLWKINIDALYANLNEIRKEIKPTQEMNSLKTLFIFGGNSPYFLKEDENYIKKNSANAKIKIIPDAGHLIHIEKEQEFVETILTFLNNE